MTRRDFWLLRLTSLWTFLVWGVFVKNLIGDDEHSAGFKAVHLTLAIVSILLAAAMWRVAARSRTGPHREPESGTGTPPLPSGTQTSA